MSKKITVQLEIDPSELNDTFVELFNSMGNKRKEEIVEKILMEWFRSDTLPSEYSKFKADILANATDSSRVSLYENNINDLLNTDGTVNWDRVVSSYGYLEGIKKLKSSKVEMMLSIKEKAIEYISKRVDEYIKEDQDFNKLLEVCLNNLGDIMPDLVIHAFSNVLFSKISDMKYQASSSMVYYDGIERFKNKIKHELGK